MHTRNLWIAKCLLNALTQINIDAQENVIQDVMHEILPKPKINILQQVEVWD
jgi:hypothetical protein